MHFIPIWVFLALAMTALTLNYGDGFLTLFFWVNACMGIGALTYLAYAKIYRYEHRNVYRYLIKYLKN